MTTHNRRSHSGWATAAKRRGESFLLCLACGYQAVAA